MYSLCNLEISLAVPVELVENHILSASSLWCGISIKFTIIFPPTYIRVPSYTCTTSYYGFRSRLPLICAALTGRAAVDRKVFIYTRPGVSLKS